MEQLRRSSKKCVFIAERDHLRIWNDHGPEERTEIIYLLLRSSIMMLCLSTRHNQSSAAQHFDRACVPLASSRAPEHQGSDRLPTFWWLWQVAKSTLYYGCLLLFVLISGIVVKSVVTQAVFQYNCPLCGG